MKKLLALLLFAVLLISFCGCNRSSKPITLDAEDITKPNYNNLYWDSYNFWATRETVLYLDIDSSKYYAKSPSKSGFVFGKSKLGGDLYVGSQVIPLNGYLYFDANDSDYETAVFGRMNVATGECETLHTLENFSYFPSPWVCTDTFFAYTVDYDKQNGHNPLYVYDIVNNKEVLVASEVESFSIVDGKLRYMTLDGLHRLYEYDLSTDTSTLLGEFTLYSRKEYITYNHTSDKVILVPMDLNNSGAECELSVFTVSTGTVETYTVPLQLGTLVTGKSYAYAICYEFSEDNWELVDNEQNGIYKINLDTGEHELLNCKIAYDTEIHVTTDDELYIMQYESGGFLGYDYKTTAFKYDFETNETTKIIEY